MGRTAKTVTVSLPPELAREVDELARDEGRTRSELFRAAIRRYIEQRQRWEELTTIARARARESGITEDDVPRLVEEYRRERRRRS